MQLKPSFRFVVYLVAASMLAGFGVLSWTQHRMIGHLREKNQVQLEKLNELSRSRVENQSAPLENDQAELNRLRKNTSELLRLRHESAVHREQLKELSALRAANEQLLQGFQRTHDSPTDRHAQLMAARKHGALLGVFAAPAVKSDDGTTLPTKHGGVMVAEINAESPVAKSDLKLGDEIIAVDGRRVGSLAQLQTEMLTRKPGDSVVLTVMREGAILHIETKTRAWDQ
jgi:C-terminal processing protease CtpA/Prc